MLCTPSLGSIHIGDCLQDPEEHAVRTPSGRPHQFRRSLRPDVARWARILWHSIQARLRAPNVREHQASWRSGHLELGWPLLRGDNRIEDVIWKSDRKRRPSEPVSLRKFENTPSSAPGLKCLRQIVSPNSSSVNCSCASGSPLPTHLARPFRIMWTASIPYNVSQAVENDWYPLASQTRFFETR
jgi:hypothetical protein